MKYFFAILIIFFCTSAFSQEIHPEMIPGRTINSEQPKSYEDSAEFAKFFKEFYPVIKPAKSMKEISQENFQAISRTFKVQGIDSAEAAKVAFKNLDEKGYEKIYFDAYRRNLSAKELKKLMEFMKTPEGKHIAEVLPGLQRVPTDANMYIVRTINSNLTPIRQAAREKWEKEHPGEKPGMHTPMAPNPMMPQHSLPKNLDSLKTPPTKQ